MGPAPAICRNSPALRRVAVAIAYFVHQFVNGMAERGWGRVINIASVNGQKGCFGQTNYSAAKAGMHGFTMALALEVAQLFMTRDSASSPLMMAATRATRPPTTATAPRIPSPAVRWQLSCTASTNR